MTLEMTSAIAVLWEHKQQADVLHLQFSPKRVHTARFEPYPHRTGLIFAHVTIGENEEAPMIRQARTEMKLSFVSEEHLHPRLEPIACRVHEGMATNSDFVLVIELEQREKLNSIQDITLNATYNNTSTLRQLTAIGRAVTWRPNHVMDPISYESENIESPHHGGFDLQQLLLNIPSSKEEDNWTVNMWDFLKARTKRHGLDPIDTFPEKLNRIREDMRYGITLEEAFHKLIEAVHCGISLIHGPPGAGKTQVLQGIMRATASMQFKTIGCAGSNSATDNLLKKNIKTILPGERETLRILHD
ncbi:MAG: hypothetical protein M1835_002177 [Candelina submexicana]|nr:MAG: hypothetical protein M1835_002177 [Candelina submexicana]